MDRTIEKPFLAAFGDSQGLMYVCLVWAYLDLQGGIIDAGTKDRTRERAEALYVAFSKLVETAYPDSLLTEIRDNLRGLNKGDARRDYLKELIEPLGKYRGVCEHYKERIEQGNPQAVGMANATPFDYLAILEGIAYNFLCRVEKLPLYEGDAIERYMAKSGWTLQPTRERVTPPELDNPKARALFMAAAAAGFVQAVPGGFHWNGTKRLCMYFSKQAGEYLKLSYEGEQSNWKPFEQIFSLTNFAQAFSNSKNEGSYPPRGYEKVDALMDSLTKSDEQRTT